MTYDARTILKRRHFVLMVIRLVAAALTVFGAYHFVYALVVAGLDGFDSLEAIWDEGFNRTGVALGGLTTGILIGTFSQRIAKWIVPSSRLLCPDCDYELRETSAGRCPECGLLLRDSDAADPESTEADQTHN